MHEVEKVNENNLNAYSTQTVETQQSSLGNRARVRAIPSRSSQAPSWAGRYGGPLLLSSRRRCWTVA